MQLNPIELLNTWIEEEKSMGAQYAQHAVLSSQGLDGAPHGRIVAIRELTKDWILLFTQKRTRKVSEIRNNNQVALTFWFERYAREVIVGRGSKFLIKRTKCALLGYLSPMGSNTLLQLCSNIREAD